MRKLVYYIACTVDGFIARKDGSFDCFLQEGEHFDDLLSQFPETIPAHLKDHFKVVSTNKRFDTVLMGRHTYAVGSDLGLTNPYPHMQQYVFSRTLQKSIDKAVELVTENGLATVQQLKQETGKDIWLCGGGELASELFPEIDELILKINPALIGKGIPLFRHEVKSTSVDILKSKGYNNGFKLIHYRLKH